MTETVMSGSMSGDAKRSDGLLGESGHERRRSQQAPPVLHATARVLDSTSRHRKFVTRRQEPTPSDTRRVGLGCRLVDPGRGWQRQWDWHPVREALGVRGVGGPQRAAPESIRARWRRARAARDRGLSDATLSARTPNWEYRRGRAERSSSGRAASQAHAPHQMLHAFVPGQRRAGPCRRLRCRESQPF